MQSDRRVALIIGCGAYSVGKPLDNPLRDATAMEACFQRLGFHEVTLVPDPKLGRLGRALADFAAAAEDAEMAALYFAGHGIEASGNNYLIPCDAELGHARRLDFEAVKLADIMRAIHDPRRHLRLIILDACRNNPYRDRMRGLDARRSVEGGLGYVEPRGNMLVAYAAEHGRTALDGDRDGNSPYAKALLSHLETPNLDIRLVFGRVRDDVVRHTKEDQTPHLYGTLGGQEIYLKANGASAPVPPQAPPLQPQSAPPRGRADQLWDEFTIGTTMEPELIQAYIGQMEREGEPLAVWKARKRLHEVVAGLKRRDEADWAAALAADTEAAYQHYLQSRPLGSRADEARTRLAKLAEDAAWRLARDAFVLQDDAAGMAALSSFLAGFPESDRAATAKEYLTTIEGRSLAAKGFVRVAVWTPKSRESRWIAPGSGGDESHVFRDFEYSPEMVIVPRGEFMMGSSPQYIAARAKKEYMDDLEDEGPQHRVIIPEPFAIGRYAVTFAEWDAFVAAGGGSHSPADQGWGRADRPAIHVNWEDAQAYLAWLSELSGATYRLPSEAEWEYAARATTMTLFWWGSSISTKRANYDGTYCGGQKGEYRKETVPVKSFEPNPWGLNQVHGNVWEWVEDCWHDSYKDKPEALKANGWAWTANGSNLRVIRGGSWLNEPSFLRSAFRVEIGPGDRENHIGLRVARTLTA